MNEFDQIKDLCYEMDKTYNKFKQSVVEKIKYANELIYENDVSMFVKLDELYSSTIHLYTNNYDYIANVHEDFLSFLFGDEGSSNILDKLVKEPVGAYLEVSIKSIEIGKMNYN